jgi:hypothetical protein
MSKLEAWEYVYDEMLVGLDMALGMAWAGKQGAGGVQGGMHGSQHAGKHGDVFCGTHTDQTGSLVKKKYTISSWNLEVCDA